MPVTDIDPRCSSVPPGAGDRTVSWPPAAAASSPRWWPSGSSARAPAPPPDTSGVPPIPHLSRGLQLAGGLGSAWSTARQGGASASNKLFNMISGVGRVQHRGLGGAGQRIPGGVDRRLCRRPRNRNMLLSQSLYSYRTGLPQHRHRGQQWRRRRYYRRRRRTGAGQPAQHVVVTFDPVDGRKIYVNGRFSGDADSSGGGLLNNWSRALRPGAGQPAGTNPWAGTIRMVAIPQYRRSPTGRWYRISRSAWAEVLPVVQRRRDTGPAGVCHVVEGDQPHQLLLCNCSGSASSTAPATCSTSRSSSASTRRRQAVFDLRGIRLGINGKLAEVGQASSTSARASTPPRRCRRGQSPGCPRQHHPLENGPDQDMFFLGFDELASRRARRTTALRAFQHTLTGQPLIRYRGAHLRRDQRHPGAPHRGTGVQRQCQSR